MKLFTRRQPVEMTEEERIAHEKYVAELNEKNEKTVKIVCAVLWCVAMVAWIILLVLGQLLVLDRLLQRLPVHIIL